MLNQNISFTHLHCKLTLQIIFITMISFIKIQRVTNCIISIYYWLGRSIEAFLAFLNQFLQHFLPLLASVFPTTFSWVHFILGDGWRWRTFREARWCTSNAGGVVEINGVGHFLKERKDTRKWVVVSWDDKWYGAWMFDMMKVIYIL